MPEQDELKEEIRKFLADRPGSPTTAVRQAVSARSSAVSQALEDLKAAGKIRNDGNGRAHAWILVGTAGEGFVLSPQEAGPGYPREIEGVRVSGWTPRSRTARALGTTLRTLSRWEDRGLPSHEDGRGKLYPWPHVLAWYSEFEVAKRRSDGKAPTRLELSVALARDHAFRVEQGWGGLYGSGGTS